MHKDALTNIHGQSNYRKAIGYWVGFLEGVIACKEITPNEADALKAQSQDLISKFFDEDAQELITELGQLWPDVTDELVEFISDIIKYRKNDIQIDEGVINENVFFGFLKGIASDDVVNINEVDALLNYVGGRAWERNEIGSDPRVIEVLKVASLAIQDGKIDAEESAELCEYITRVVGDSYADTGISEQADVPQLDGTVLSLNDIKFQGNEFCMTGNFGVPKSIIGKAIAARGGSVNRAIRSTTRYLILASSGSEHYVTSNAGTKILTAVKMREDGKPIEFVMEPTIKPLIDAL